VDWSNKVTANAECKHWYIDHTNETDPDNQTRYCRDCRAIMTRIDTWYGSVQFGTAKSTFEYDRFGPLEFGMPIEDALSELALLHVTIESVAITDGGWGSKYQVRFTLGKSPTLTALVTVSPGTRNQPTGEYLPEPVDEIPAV
jgi:hypothetical protein